MPVVTEEQIAPSPRKLHSGPVAEPGMMVRWFSHADINNAPCAALVISTDGMWDSALRKFVNSNGVLTVELHKPTGARELAYGCRHVDDPWNNDHPDARDRSGGWDYVYDVRRQQLNPPKPDLRTPKVKAD